MSRIESKESLSPATSGTTIKSKSATANTNNNTNPNNTSPGTAAANIDSSHHLSSNNIKKNAKGGIHVSPSELHQAFEFFDSDNKGYITIQDLKRRLGVFYQNLSLREYKFLMNNKSELSENELYELLQQNELTNYDPVAEAFKIYDPQDTGYMDINVFKEILINLGFNDINQQDIQTLIDTADIDQDGKVSLNDFRKMLPTHTHNTNNNNNSQSLTQHTTNDGNTTHANEHKSKGKKSS